MRTPATPVERLQPFRPPFCPWPDCSEHLRRTRGFRVLRLGSYRTRRRPRIPRFRCRACGRTFSRQSFATSYYLKRPELLVPIAAGLVAGSAHRQLARSLGCAPSTVTRLSARLGRHSILLLAQALDSLHGRLSEPLVADHFETFEYSQDFPFGALTVLGRLSGFLYTLDAAPHRRAGRKSPHQVKRQTLTPAPPRPSRGGYTGSFRRALDTLLPHAPARSRLRIACDGQPAYRHASRGRSVRLEVHPNPPRRPKGATPSPEAIVRNAAMHPVDHLHALLRHSLAHHRRETIAFGRRINALMERLFLTAVWRNFVKRRTERRPDPTTPAMHLGLAETPWTWRQVLSRRRFRGRLDLPQAWTEIYRRDWITPILPSNSRHRCAHAD